MSLLAGTALLFPGQGSQRADMRETVRQHAPEFLDLVSTAVGTDPFDRVDEGTHFAQPAIFCRSLAGWRALGEPNADFFAGHSLGEIAALVAARALAIEDGIRLVALRGWLMQEASLRHPGSGMLAVKAGWEDVAYVAADLGLDLGNDNSPRQVVLAGSAVLLNEAAARLRKRRVRSTRLPVAGAFHSRCMQGAVAEFRAAVYNVRIGTPRTPAISGVTGRPYTDVHSQLVQSLTQPVLWRQAVLYLRANGVDRFVEVGPGQVLTRLVSQILDEREAPLRDRPMEEALLA